MTPITKLKQSEYREGAKLAFENFEDLIELSDKAALIGNYGAASSLCVLALEELSKSVILQFKAINNSIPIKNLEKYFTSHETKQNTGISLFVTMQSRYRNDDEILSKENSPNPANVIAIAVIALLITWALNKEKETNKNNKSHFDSIKESGFYVGYDETSRKWISPKSEHDKESFNELSQLIREFAEDAKNWIFNGNLNNENIIDFLNSLDDEIIDKKRLNEIKY